MIERGRCPANEGDTSSGPKTTNPQVSPAMLNQHGRGRPRRIGRQAAEMVTGKASYARLEQILEMERIAANRELSKDLRKVAEDELAAIRNGGPVDPGYQKVKAAQRLAELMKSGDTDVDEDLDEALKQQQGGPPSTHQGEPSPPRGRSRQQEAIDPIVRAEVGRDWTAGRRSTTSSRSPARSSPTTGRCSSASSTRPRRSPRPSTSPRKRAAHLSRDHPDSEGKPMLYPTTPDDLRRRRLIVVGIATALLLIAFVTYAVLVHRVALVEHRRRPTPRRDSVELTPVETKPAGHRAPGTASRPPTRRPSPAKWPRRSSRGTPPRS